MKTRGHLYVRAMILMISLLTVWCGATLSTFAADGSSSAAIYARKNAAALQQLFAANGFKTTLCEEATLSVVIQSHPEVLVIGEETTFPPVARKTLSDYLAHQGNLVVLCPSAFDYLPDTRDERDPAGFAPLSAQNLRKQLGKKALPAEAEEITAKPTVIPGQAGGALQVNTPLIGLGDVYLEIPLPSSQDTNRSVISFWAKGDYEVDVLTVKVEDSQGNQWVGFEETGREWQYHRLPMANLIRLGPASAGSEGQLDPREAAKLLIGMDKNVLWFDKPGSFALGRVSLETRAGFAGVPTSALRKWRACLQPFRAAFPEWIVDPFLDARRLANPARLELLPNPVLDPPIPSQCARVAFVVPPLLVNAKSRVVAGTDKAMLEEFRRDSLRRIPLLCARDSTGKELGNVAEIRIHTGGLYQGAGLALFGLTGQDYGPANRLGELVVAAAQYLVGTPRILEWTPHTFSFQEDPSPLRCGVVVQNPLPRTIQGKISLSVAGRLSGQAAIAVKAHSSETAVVALGAVPADFPLTNFEWRIDLSAEGRKDAWKDTVSLERAAINNCQFMVKLMQTHKDGRISHHFFADMYGARALEAMGRYLQQHKEAAERNRESLEGWTGEQFRESAKHWCDMLTAVQDGDGSFPLGYGEAEQLRWVADAGSIALGLAQLASWQEDSRKRTYLEAAKEYFHWKDSFYISQQKSEALQRLYGKGAGWTKWGTYGLGLMSYDMLSKEKWGERRRAERGPDYVLGLVMGVNGALAAQDSEPAFKQVMRRDANRFIGGHYPASGYFQAEGAFWMYYLADEPQLRAAFKQALEDSFLPSVVNGGKHDGFAHGGRQTLSWLSLVYYYQYIENSPRVRAALLRALWEQASPSSSYSVFTAAERFSHSSHGTSIAASKYAGGCSAIWFMELLDPGATLLKGVAVPAVK
jgi:hypothetical protein